MVEVGWVNSVHGAIASQNLHRFIVFSMTNQ